MEGASPRAGQSNPAAPFVDELVAAGLDPTRRSLVLWEGNSMYIPLDRIAHLLSTLRERLPRASVAFDYLPGAIARGEAAGTERLTGAFSDLGAPWITGIDDLARLAKDTGYVVRDEAVFAELLGELRPHRALDPELAGTYSGCMLVPSTGDA